MFTITLFMSLLRNWPLSTQSS